MARVPGVIILGKPISSGSFGEIVNSTYYGRTWILTDYVGQKLKPREEYAIKVPKGKSTLDREIQVLSNLGDDTNIIKLYGTASIRNERQERPYHKVMVMEKLRYTLADMIEIVPLHDRIKRFPDLLRDTFKALAFLDSNGYVHLDLHRKNIMFDVNFVPKLIDFGLTKRVGDGEKFIPFHFSPDEVWRHFHPPEQRMKIGDEFKYGECTRKFDVYSMAVNMIDFIYDHKSSPISFYELMTRTILRLHSTPIKYNFSTLDALGQYPTASTLYDSIHIGTSGSMRTRFARGTGGEPILVLDMPPAYGQILIDCLKFEDDRHSAPQVLQAIKQIDKKRPAAALPYARADNQIRRTEGAASATRGRGLPRAATRKRPAAKKANPDPLTPSDRWSSGKRSGGTAIRNAPDGDGGITQYIDISRLRF